VLLALTPVSRSLVAQTAYTAAGASTSILPLEHGFLTFDFSEAKLGLTFARPLDLPCGGVDCVADQLNFTLHTSGAARKGQSNLFTKLDFNPGFDVGGGISFVSRGPGGYNAVFLRATFATHERDVISFQMADNAIDTLVSLTEESQHTFAATIGFNHAFSDVTILGLGFEARRERSTPGAQLPREYCTPGSSASGLSVSVCSDRYVAPLADLWTGQARLDMILGLATMGSRPDAARFGLITGVSVDFVEDASNAVNFALGPSIHLAGYPGQAVVALVFGLRDAFDAHGLASDDPQRGSYLSEHLSVRLPVSVPFKVLVN
jgi:hypothetical protein